MVFNHTAEGDERGPTISFRGIDNTVYYILDPATAAYLNYSGCGNTLNCNHPVVRDLMKKNPLSVEVTAPGADKPLATGRIAFLDNAVDQTTGTIKVRAVFDNAGVALWPGQFVTVRVKLYDQENAIVVPSRALQTGPGGQFVYVVKPDMIAEMRKVVVTRTEGDIAVLAAGPVAREDKVVVRGALRLMPGAKVTIQDSASAP